MSDARSNHHRQSTRHRVRRWVLLTANRSTIAGVLTLSVFVVLVVTGTLNLTPLRVIVREGTHVERLFQSFTMSLITLITLVVTLNQLVLSRELAPLGQQRSRMSGAVEFRQDVEELLGTVAPSGPKSFMQALLDLQRERASALEDSVADAESDLREPIEELVEELRERADETDQRLDGARFGRFEVVPVVLDFQYSHESHAVRRLRDEHAEELTTAQEGAFADLVQVLQLFGPAREHVKTMYFRWELVEFSRRMLYLGVPALVVSIASLLYLNPNSFPGSILGVENVVVVVALTSAVAASPFFLLVAYILRLGTIAQRTLAVGPFVLPASDHDAYEWEAGEERNDGDDQDDRDAREGNTQEELEGSR